MKHFLSISCLILTTILKYHHYFRVTETQRCKILYSLKVTQLTTSRSQGLPGIHSLACKALKGVPLYRELRLRWSLCWRQKYWGQK